MFALKRKVLHMANLGRKQRISHCRLILSSKHPQSPPF
nr:MAG TPA: hypothetical protein [Bacteriophage sp.]